MAALIRLAVYAALATLLAVPLLHRAGMRDLRVEDAMATVSRAADALAAFAEADVPDPDPARPAWIAAAPLPPADAPVPARLAESSRSDLTVPAHNANAYVPEPGQGTRFATGAGTVWWGWGPPGDGPHPAVILLHGGGKRTGESMVDMWREAAERQGVVLVAPDMGRVEGWSEGDVAPEVLLDALADADARYGIDPDRVGLFGHSRGGIVAQVLANRHEGPWRAVAVHAGTVPAAAMRPVAKAVPIRHYIGSRDRTFPYAEARRSAEAIAAKGHPYDLVRLEGHDHWFYAGGEGIAAEAWAWLDRAMGAEGTPPAPEVRRIAVGGDDPVEDGPRRLRADGTAVPGRPPTLDPAPRLVTDTAPFPLVSGPASDLAPRRSAPPPPRPRR